MNVSGTRRWLAIVALAAAGCRQPDAGAQKWVEPFTGMPFVRVEAGRFVMGSPEGEPGREAQEQPHRVTLTRPFWLGVFEVTQREWSRVMGMNPSHFRDADGALPVEEVTWFEVHSFLDRLNAQTPGNRFRLPSEAEWEYACRAGTTTAYATGSTLPRDAANVSWNPSGVAGPDGKTTPRGTFAPNAWGLYDMHGNVWEWTDDDACGYAGGDAVDPRSSCGGPLKSIRGGSWYFAADSARCALRYTHRPGDRGFSLGFRVLREG
jgi:formylglycine-generating enzyme required for sulfatase activity